MICTLTFSSRKLSGFDKDFLVLSIIRNVELYNLLSKMLELYVYIDDTI